MKKFTTEGTEFHREKRIKLRSNSVLLGTWHMPSAVLCGKKIIICFIILLLSGCGRTAPITVAEQTPPEQTTETIRRFVTPEPALEQEVHQPRFTGQRIILCREKAQPGEPLVVAFTDSDSAPEGLRATLLNAAGRRLSGAQFFSLSREEGEQEVFAAVLAIPNTAAAGNVTVRVESPAGIIRDLPFTIEPREFFAETIHLNPVNTAIRTDPSPQRTREADQLWAILNTTGDTVYSGAAFLRPIASTRVTSLYGSRRIYQYAGGGSDTTIHAGIDFGIPTGTEVWAAARGRVALARFRMVTGYTVILEHLPGLYSLYYHMNRIVVQEGSIVEVGQRLGESGATGLATGPHLHWEIRISGENADPNAFVGRPVLDKNHLLAKLMDSD